MPPPSPFSLRPWPTGDKKPKTMGEFIARANAGPGGFRSLNADDLRAQIEARKTGTTPVEPSAEMEIDAASDSDEEGDNQTMTTEALRKARDEVLKNIEIAHQSAMMTQDLVSLLMSKENPTTAKTTISPHIASLKLIGTLGADKLAAPQVNAARILDGKTMATGWKLIEVDKTVDSVMVAATRLQKEISLETAYWAEVLGVSEKGWSVCRLPYEKQTLGVRFGFSESTPEFQKKNLAPMRRKADGSVDLAAASVAQSQRVRVSIERDQTIVGRSALPSPTPPDAPLEARVLEARNTIFHQELWHEINREARTLLAHNVRLDGSTVVVEMDKSTKAVFSLVTLGEDEPAASTGSDRSSEDVLAETVSSALSLLLSHAHRLNMRMRSQPGPPHLRRSRLGQPYALIKGVMAYLEYENSVGNATRFMSDLTVVLQSAGYPHASYTLTEPSITISSSSARHASSSEALLSSLTTPREFQLELTMTPKARVLISGTTILYPNLLTSYTVRLLPPSDDADAPEDEPPPSNVLRTLFPPAEFYPNFREVMLWIAGAVPRVMADEAEEFAFKLAKLAPVDSEERRDFVKSISGIAVHGTQPDQSDVKFEIRLSGIDLKSGGGREPDAEKRLSGQYAPELHVFGKWSAPSGNGDVLQHEWIWSVDRKESMSLEEVYQGLLRGDLVL
ncbi:RNA polymerase II mediator complex subunit [Pyricularia oryzae]